MLKKSYDTTEISLVLHKCFVNTKALKCDCLVDFYITSLPTMHAHTVCMHIVVVWKNKY